VVERLPEEGMSKLTSPLVWAGILAAVALAVMITVAERTRRDVRRSIDAVSHTLDVQKAFNLVLKASLDAETGQRGFLLTGAQSYLAPYRQAQASIAFSLANLEDLTENDPHHHARIRQLIPLVREKMSELAETTVLAERGQRDAAVTVVSTDRGRLLMERIRALLDQAFVDEQRVLRTRQASPNDALIRRALWSNGMAVLLVALGIAALRLRQRLRRLQPLVTVCAWSKTVEDGDEWVTFEEYLHRRFGLRVTHGLSPEQVAKLMRPAPPQLQR
jgi:CHASE3 domain sensor protein